MPLVWTVRTGTAELNPWPQEHRIGLRVVILFGRWIRHVTEVALSMSIRLNPAGPLVSVPRVHILKRTFAVWVSRSSTSPDGVSSVPMLKHSNFVLKAILNVR